MSCAVHEGVHKRVDVHRLTKRHANTASTQTASQSSRVLRRTGIQTCPRRKNNYVAHAYIQRLCAVYITMEQWTCEIHALQCLRDYGMMKE